MKEHLGTREGIQDVGEKVVAMMARDRNEGGMGIMKSWAQTQWFFF